MKWDCIFFWIVSTCSCFFPAGHVIAQLSESDSSFYQLVVSGAVNLYHFSAGDQSGLYNGSLYPGYPFHFKNGSPFFNSNKLDTGSVIYDDILYENLPLLYDNLKDVVIIDDNGSQIQLNSKKISEFTLPGHHFIRLGKNDMNNSRIINTGFYEILYNGYNSVLKRVIKTIEDDLSSGEVVERVIHQSDYYYFKKDNAIYPAENKKDITAIFSDRKKEVQQFIRKNKLNLRKDKENVLLRIASYLNR
jgi:hypothetical protein